MEYYVVTRKKPFGKGYFVGSKAKLLSLRQGYMVQHFVKFTTRARGVSEILNFRFVSRLFFFFYSFPCCLL